MADTVYRSIIHPTDFSQNSEPAYAHALKLALAVRGHIMIAHSELLAEDEAPDWDAFPAVRTTLANWGLLANDAPKSDVYDRLGLMVRKAELGERDPARALNDYIDRHGCDLIVLATRARENLPGWMQGSVAEKIANKARIATLFMPHGCPNFIDPKDGAANLNRILIPVDHEPDPRAALNGTIKLMDALEADQAEIHLLHVGDAGDGPMTSLKNNRNLSLHRHERTGSVVEAIASVANEIDASLLVLSTAGRDGFLDAFRGSTTERVLRGSGRPVLAVPA